MQNEVGLDFGTSTTVVSTSAGATALFGHQTLIPSVAFFDDNSNEWLFAEEAVSKAAPGALIINLKSAITINSDEIFTRDKRRVFPADLVITNYLEYVAQEMEFDQTFATRTVRMSCPADWDKFQRNRLLKCAKDAGLEVIGNVLLDEPVSAAVGWLEARVQKKQDFFGKRILVFDMGGGTLDLALLDVYKKVQSIQEVEYHVIASTGSQIAGNAVDAAIAKNIYESAELNAGQSAAIERNGGISYFLTAARELKEALSSEDIADLLEPIPGESEVNVRLSQNELRQILVEVFEQSTFGDSVPQSIEKLLRRGAATTLTKSGTLADLWRIPIADLAREIDAVLLVGGMAHMPMVSEYIENFFAKILEDDGPGMLPGNKSVVQEVVALGLAQPGVFTSLNMMRPDFDVILRVYDAREETDLASHVIWDAYRMPYQTSFNPLRPAGFLEQSENFEVPTPVGYLRNEVAGEIRVFSHQRLPLRVYRPEEHSGKSASEFGRAFDTEFGFYFKFGGNSTANITMNSAGVFIVTDEGGNKTYGQLQVWPEPRILAGSANYKSDGGNKAGDEVG